MIMPRLAALFALVVVIGAPLRALAQSKPVRGNIVMVRETTVVGRIQKPVAAQEIGKLPTRLQSGDPKRSFLDRIEGATASSPF
jgi:phage FluMu protein gp41